MKDARLSSLQSELFHLCDILKKPNNGDRKQIKKLSESGEKELQNTKRNFCIIETDCPLDCKYKAK